MKIAILASNLFRIPPVSPRATETMVYLLTEELVRRGHEVTLFASADSQTSAKLVSIGLAHSASQKDISWTGRHLNFELALVSKAYQMVHQFDLIHVNLGNGEQALHFASFVKTPTVVTVHGELVSSHLKKFFSIYKILDNFFFVSISDAQRQPLPELPWIRTVYHGVDFDDFEFQEKGDGYLAYLGRLSPNKGVHLAIEAARLTKQPLKIAGGDKQIHLDYFEEKILPALDGHQVKYLGEISSRKECSRFLKNAKALLFPVQWEEPFGLVMIEAMACGTPVIAFNRGSVPEVIKDGKTGFLVNNVEEMVKAIKKIDQINRRDCRTHVEKNFTVEKMVDNYEEVYKTILAMQ